MSGFPLAVTFVALLTWVMVPAGTVTSGVRQGARLVICMGRGALSLEQLPGAPAISGC